MSTEDDKAAVEFWEDHAAVEFWEEPTPTPSAATEDTRLTAELLRERFQWQKIQKPQFWNPREVGEEIVGYYGGRTLKNGTFGQYEVVIIHVPRRGSLLASGTELIQLLDAALIQKGHPIRVVWGGRTKIGGDREKKRFELYVAEGDPIAAEDLPEVHP